MRRSVVYRVFASRRLSKTLYRVRVPVGQVPCTGYATWNADMPTTLRAMRSIGAPFVYAVDPQLRVAARPAAAAVLALHGPLEMDRSLRIGRFRQCFDEGGELFRVFHDPGLQGLDL